jgi:hypothetical protein
MIFSLLVPITRCGDSFDLPLSYLAGGVIKEAPRARRKQFHRLATRGVGTWHARRSGAKLAARNQTS